MSCCTLDAIKQMTKIQVNNFILIFFCFLYCVYGIIFISMVVVKEIIFNCVMYAVTVCGTDWKQSLYTIKDSYLVYTNENKESGGIAALVMK